MIELDIESFVDLLELSSLDTTELSDILWLAKYMKTDKRYYITKEKVKESPDYGEINKIDTTSKEEIKNPASNEKQIETIKESNDYNVPLSVNNKNKETNKTINISHKGYFDDSNQVSKYLIDFKGKTLSKRKKLFDEITTINYKANTGILNPFFKAKKQKLYILYLFIDYSSSMNVWKDMINEYAKLLSKGIFKSVKHVYINSDNGKTLFYKDKKLNKLFSPKEITNFHNDKLIFVLTDMLSNGWKNGDTLKIVAKLYKSIPVYIVQMLPYRLWRTTALKKASITTFNSIQNYPVKDSYNSEIDHLLKSLGTNSQKNLKLPIVSFDLAYLKVIGKTLKAKEDNKIDGAIFNLDYIQNNGLIAETKILTGQEKVEYFFANASVKAQELAKCLSAVQFFNLPIIRIIQEKVLNETCNLYIAEIINSGLVNSNDKILEFNDDVCDVLYKLLGRERALEIAYKNSDYIQENLGANFGFKAYLSGAVNQESIELSEHDKKFATMSCRILKSMGGEYKDFANLLQKNYINNPNYIPRIASMKNNFISRSNKNNTTLKPIRLVAVGVGGGGGNVIGHMINKGVAGIEMILINTDAQIFAENNAATKIQIGTKLTKGLGAGIDPAIGKESALENYEDIRTALEGSDIVFILAGLGGGTGTGAAPVVAQIAKEIGALTISIVTKPFRFESKKRLKIAEDGLEELKDKSDSVIVIPNDNLLSVINKKLGLKDDFKVLDGVLSQAVMGISGVLLTSGENDINLDFADLQVLMSNKGMALMGIGEYEGENAAYEAIKIAFEFPLFDNMSINGVMGVLVHFNVNPNFPMIEISEAMEVVHESVHEDAEIIFGTSTDESLSENYVKITLIATGFENYKWFNEVEKLVIKNLKANRWTNNDISMDAEDYVDILLTNKNETIAVVELKSQKILLDKGLKKAIDYAKKLNVEFAFATDGKEIHEYNLITSEENIIFNFPSPDSLKKRIVNNSQLISYRTMSEQNINKKLLWVDNKPDNNKDERKMFENESIAFDLALSTNEALEYLKDNKYLAIISDMGRKEGAQEGYVLLDKLREIDKNIPLFFYAGSNLEEHKKMALERGAQGSTNNSAELYKMVMNLIQKNENSIIEEDDNTKSATSDITFECIECGTEYFTGCTELDWEQVGGSERGMGTETEYEAEYYETCHECNNDMNITFNCWEYPVGIENHRSVSGKGIKNLKGNCCLEFNLSYIEDYDEFTVNADTYYGTLEEKIEDLEIFLNNLIPYSELEFTYDTEDFSDEKDIPFDRFLISREFDSQYLDDLIDEIQEDINEIRFAIEHMKHDNLANNISNNSLLLKKQYTIEYDGITDAYGIDIDCNIYEEDNEQILYISPSSKIEFDEDILDVEEEIVDIDIGIDKAEAEMKEWFFKNYEDPANFLPYTVYGSPYKFDEILYKEFGDKYPDYYIQKAIENLENEHGDISWTKRPKEDRDLEIIKSIKKYSVYELSHFFIISLQMHGVNSGIIDRLMTLNKRCDFLYELYKILDEATRGTNQENRQNIINDFCKKIDFEFNFINDYMILRKIFDNCKKYNEIHNIESDEENLNIDKAEEEMKDWFLENYDDPVNFLPHESREGGFQYLYGGPYELDEILYEEFGGKYPDDYIQKVIENLEHEHGDIAWGKRPSETDVYEEGVYAEKGYTDQKVYIPSSGGKVYEFDVSNKFYDINIYKISEQAIKESQALKEMIVEKGATHQGTVSFHNDIKGNIDELNKLIKDFQDIFGQEKGLSFYSIMHSEDDIYKYNSKTSKNIDIDNVINATIDGDFEGWSGESIVKLTNGETWKQSEYYYEYIYAFMPNAIITHSQTGYKMKVDGVNEEVGVEKLKNVIESKIRGSFNGWSGNTIVELINDEKWKQSTYKYSYSYAYSPDVIIYQSGYGFKMKVDGNNETVDVERVI